MADFAAVQAEYAMNHPCLRAVKTKTPSAAGVDGEAGFKEAVLEQEKEAEVADASAKELDEAVRDAVAAASSPPKSLLAVSEASMSSASAPSCLREFLAIPALQKLALSKEPACRSSKARLEKEAKAK